MKKEILLIARSNGCLERIAGLCFFLKERYRLIVILDSTKEPIDNLFFIKIIKKNCSKIISIKKNLFFQILAIFRIFTKTDFLHRYVYFILAKEILRKLNLQFVISDLNEVAQEYNNYPRNLTMVIRKILTWKKIICFKTGTHLNNSINFYKNKKIYFRCKTLFVSTLPEKKFFNKINKLTNVVQSSEICFDLKFLKYLENFIKVKKNTKDIIYFFSNLQEIDKKLAGNKEYELNVKFINILLDFCIVNKSKLYVKFHPRLINEIYTEKKLRSCFSKLQNKYIIILPISTNLSALELIYKFDNVAMLYSTCLIQSILLKKKIIVSEYLFNLNKKINFLSDNLNFINLKKKKFLFKNLKKSSGDSKILNFAIEHDAKNIHKTYLRNIF